jgi:hypothetical protein
MFAENNSENQPLSPNIVRHVSIGVMRKANDAFVMPSLPNHGEGSSFAKGQNSGKKSIRSPLQLKKESGRIKWSYCQHINETVNVEKEVCTPKQKLGPSLAARTPQSANTPKSINKIKKKFKHILPCTGLETPTRHPVRAGTRTPLLKDQSPCERFAETKLMQVAEARSQSGKFVATEGGGTPARSVLWMCYQLINIICGVQSRKC